MRLRASNLSIGIDQLSVASRALAKRLYELQQSDAKLQSNSDEKNAVPRSQRWLLNLAARDLDEYAKMLDHFRIELGVIGRPGVVGIEYAVNFSTTPSQKTILLAGTPEPPPEWPRTKMPFNS